MDDSDITDFLDSDSNFELPDHSRFGAMIEDQQNFINSFKAKTSLAADQKAKESQRKLNKLDKDIARGTKDVEEFTLKIQKLQRELDALNEEHDSIEERNSQEMKELIELETLVKNRSSFKLHPVDAQRFENSRFRLFACKSLTGIRWNFTESNDKKLVGYVGNAHTEQIKKFVIDLAKTDHADVAKQLWSMILACGFQNKPTAASTHPNDNKEN
ncbi:hypothetical protein LSTR_LSTR013934 [Laodelphax striatellus]|uniref:Kinetochore protein Spc24 n=1 Tax=Laodelphax striatellus TaxID=195883 RepID=A0A482XJ62_LAOST|nr:hypothetical protein LSTR_LSTR013934 [Laodelphax striatellus]